MITRNHKKSLSARQEIAMTEVLAGKADKQTAKAAGVTRETISRWKNHDPHFQAEYNKRLREI